MEDAGTDFYLDERTDGHYIHVSVRLDRAVSREQINDCGGQFNQLSE